MQQIKEQLQQYELFSKIPDTILNLFDTLTSDGHQCRMKPVAMFQARMPQDNRCNHTWFE